MLSSFQRRFLIPVAAVGAIATALAGCSGAGGGGATPSATATSQMPDLSGVTFADRKSVV